MQFKQTLLILILCPVFAFSQTTYLPQGDKGYVLLERMEILMQNDSILSFSKIKPYSRKNIAQWADDNSQIVNYRLNGSKVDQYNLKVF